MILVAEDGIWQLLVNITNQKTKVKNILLSYFINSLFLENVFFLKPYNDASSKIILMTSTTVISDKHT